MSLFLICAYVLARFRFVLRPCPFMPMPMLCPALLCSVLLAQVYLSTYTYSMYLLYLFFLYKHTTFSRFLSFPCFFTPLWFYLYSFRPFSIPLPILLINQPTNQPSINNINPHRFIVHCTKPKTDRKDQTNITLLHCRPFLFSYISFCTFAFFQICTFRNDV